MGPARQVFEPFSKSWAPVLQIFGVWDWCWIPPPWFRGGHHDDDITISGGTGPASVWASGRVRFTNIDNTYRRHHRMSPYQILLPSPIYAQRKLFLIHRVAMESVAMETYIWYSFRWTKNVHYDLCAISMGLQGLSIKSYVPHPARSPTWPWELWIDYEHIFLRQNK